MELSKRTMKLMDAEAEKLTALGWPRILISQRITNLRRTLQLDMTNRKPYRNKREKIRAKEDCFKEVFGRWRGTYICLNVPVRFHSEAR